MKYLTFTAVGTIHNVENASAVISFKSKIDKNKNYFIVLDCTKKIEPN